MEIRLLGPVEVWAMGLRLDSGPPQRRAVLAALAVEAGRLVTTEALIDRVWGDEPPAAPRPAIHAIVTRIRRMLHEAKATEERPPVLEARRGGGYLLHVDPDRVDLLRFQDLAGTARQSADADRAALLDEALDLWRGTALAGVPGTWAERMRQSWDLERLDAAIDWARTELRLGRHDRVIGRVRPLLAEHPLAEPLVVVSMRALTAAGRVAEAIECYATTRTRLAEHLGTDPGPELRELHEEILRGQAEPAPAQPAQPGQPAQAAESGGAGASAPGHRNDLPGDVADFTGREFEIRLIDTATDENRHGTAVTMVAVDGMAGVGKTTLAVHAAHRLAGQYPDGQLLVDLRGHAADQEPAQPSAVLDTLLRAVGTPGDQIPESLDERSALWRARLAERRMLVVLDNAASAAQVRPLLPGTPGCLTLITSRRRMADLDAAQIVSLDVLPPRDAIALFGRIAGSAHAAADPDAVGEVVRLCGYLPLAIRIAAARLRTRPAWTTAELARRLTEGTRRLNELAAGDRSVAAAFELSYRHLTEAQARLFRLLGLVPGPDFDGYAAAALTGLDVDDVGALLEQLVDVHLLQQGTPDRYRFHDLLRSHAAEVARAVDPDDELHAATGRLLDFYLDTTKRAAGWVDPRDVRIKIAPVCPPVRVPELDSRARAFEWLEAEYANLLAAVEQAVRQGWYTHAWQLPHLMHYFFHIRGRTDALAAHKLALAAARQLGDRSIEAEMLKNVGAALWHAMRLDEAIEYHEQALALYRASGDLAGESDILNNLGLVYDRLGRFDEAIHHYQQALPLRLRSGKRRGEAATLQNLANVFSQLGRYADAAHHHERSLAILRDLDERGGQAIVLNNLGIVHMFQKKYDQALRDCERSIALATEAGDEWTVGNALNTIGNIHRELGRLDESIAVLGRALAVAGNGGAPGAEHAVVVSLGQSYHAAGRDDEARDAFQRGLELAVDSGYRYGEAEARRGLGRVLAATDPDAARLHRERALAIFTELGVPEAQQMLVESGADKD